MKKYKIRKISILNSILTFCLALAALSWQPLIGQTVDRRFNSGNAANTFNKVEIYPMASNNNTNCFTVYDKTGTNYFRLAPTNTSPQIQFRTGGILYTGVTCNINVTGTNNGNFTNMVFKNGLLVNGP